MLEIGPFWADAAQNGGLLHGMILALGKPEKTR